MFRKMLLEEGITPTEVTLVAALGACVNPSYLDDGKFIHMYVSNMGFESNVIVATALITMYGKCGMPHLARSAYDKIPDPDVVAWTSMIVVYSNYGYGAEAFELFGSSAFEPNEVTLIGVLGACTDLSKGLLIHRYVVENGFGSNVILGTALMNMYGRSGSLRNAHVVFHKLQPCDIVCWNSMIGVLSQYGNSRQAIRLFREMQCRGIRPDRFTFISLLASCTAPAALADGIFIHENLESDGTMEKDIVVCNALVNMYAKCGDWEKAYSVFVNMEEHNLMSWNAIITGCCQHGHPADVLKLFESMQKEGIKPDEVTYLCLLNAYSHAGRVEDCYGCFLAMLQDANLKPWIEHLTCIVGLLGRSGRLDDAEHVIHKAGFELDAVIWTTLLSACREYGDVDRARRIANVILKLDPTHDAACVLLGHTYFADAGRADAEKV
jgi:pentatricopeptide repeat protein